jgi:hypothetical protein
VLWYLQIHCYHRRLTVPLLGDLWEVSWMRWLSLFFKGWAGYFCPWLTPAGTL